MHAKLPSLFWKHFFWVTLSALPYGTESALPCDGLFLQQLLGTHACLFAFFLCGCLTYPGHTRCTTSWRVSTLLAPFLKVFLQGNYVVQRNDSNVLQCHDMPCRVVSPVQNAFVVAVWSWRCHRLLALPLHHEATGCPWYRC